jgi:hypothetical protein
LQGFGRQRYRRKVKLGRDWQFPQAVLLNEPLTGLTKPDLVMREHTVHGV